MDKFARKCSATGKGINEGYCVNDGEFYFSDKSQLVKWLKTLEWEDCNGNRSQDITNDEDLLEFFYNEDQYYWSEWYDEEGNLQEVN